MTAIARSFPVEVLWCPNSGKGRSNRWSFPPNVEKLLRRETEGKRVLHPFGGRAKWGVRMDIDPIVRPDVIADAWMPPFGRDSFDVVILDPPYVHFNAQMKVALFRAYCWIARERVIWFHTQWSSTYGGVKHEKAYLVRVGDNCHVRCLQFFTPREPKRPPFRRFLRGPGIKYNRWFAGEMPLPFFENDPVVQAVEKADPHDLELPLAGPLLKSPSCCAPDSAPPSQLSSWPNFGVTVMPKVIVRVSCSWCQEFNEVLAERKTWCFSCGHRADVPRIECDCPQCRAAHAKERRRQE